MIKYVELTAPEQSAFRHAKILSIEVNEGDTVKKGDTLFRVKSGSNEVNLPTTKDGKVIEIIATLEESITISTPLILLETEVDKSTVSSPADEDPEEKSNKETRKKSSKKKKTAKKKTTKKVQKKLSKKVDKQQSLDLDHDLAPVNNTSNEPIPIKNMVENRIMSTVQIKVPDIGADSAKVIDILVKVGDQIIIDDPIITLESDKASMDVPSTEAGVVNSIAVSVDEDLNEGDTILELSILEFSKEKATETDNSESPVKNTDPSNSKIDEITEEEQNDQAAPAKPNANKTAAQSATTAEVKVPDIGGDSAKVIEILVSVGDTIAIEDPLVTLESDKASMDVPSTLAGTVESIEIQVDQDISEGVTVIKVKTDSAPAKDSSEEASEVVESPVVANEVVENPAIETLVDVVVPDIGGDSAKVIEVFVEEGQEIQLEESLITLESDKASMDVPSSATGVIQSIKINLDEEVSQGMIIAQVLSSGEAPSSTAQAAPKEQAVEPAKQAESNSSPAPSSMPATAATTAPAGKAHASPSIRRFARELGVDLTKVSASGRKGRIVKSDVKAHVKNIMLNGNTSSTTDSGIPPIPAIDFSKFGETDTQSLNKIKKLTAKNLHRSWLNVPHVTHNDESNISDLEAFRKNLNKEFAAQENGIKLSPLAFIVKAVITALRTYPQFNSSLSPDGESIIYKKYFNIGIAVETPNGLVVPVIRNADTLSVSEIATAMGELAKKARDKKLSPADMSGASFTISSLGGIGGTSFTPIVNAPEVAILGVARSKMHPVWDGEKFEPGMILPLSLSYDHRIIDGAEAARFTAHIAAALEDVRRLTV